MELKYIMWEIQFDSAPSMCIPIIFPKILVHAEMAHSTNHTLRRSIKNMKSMCVISAGFIDIDKLETYGESESIGVESRPEDGDIIKYHHYASGMEGMTASVKRTIESMTSKPKVPKAKTVNGVSIDDFFKK
jgi:hypothetical protein